MITKYRNPVLQEIRLEFFSEYGWSLHWIKARSSMYEKFKIEKGVSVFAKFISNETEERCMTLTKIYDAVILQK